MRRNLLCAAVTLLVSMSFVEAVPVFAHGGATGIVKQRMDAMGDMGKATKKIGQLMQNKTKYDGDIVRAEAGIIHAHAGGALLKSFPEGSLMEPSEATEQIWSDWDRFSLLANQLAMLAEGLALAADNPWQMGDKNTDVKGPSALAQDGPVPSSLATLAPNAVFSLLVKNCSACHSDFRQEKY